MNTTEIEQHAKTKQQLADSEELVKGLECNLKDLQLELAGVKRADAYAITRLEAVVAASEASRKRDGKWLDKWGSCVCCGGEIPHGHCENCDIYKMEKRIRELEASRKELENALGVIVASGWPTSAMIEDGRKALANVKGEK